MYYTNFNIYDLCKNLGYYYFEPVNTNNNIEIKTNIEKAPVNNGAETAQAPSNERATTEAATTAAPSVSNYERRVRLVKFERQKNG